MSMFGLLLRHAGAKAAIAAVAAPPVGAALQHVREGRPGPAAGNAPCNGPPPRIEPAPST